MTAVTGATAEIADYALATGYADLPANVRREGLRSFFNIVGCTVGGARHEAMEASWRALAPFAGGPQATLIGRGVKSDALTACLVNTLASSIYTYDDTHAEAVVHPAGPVMGAVLAVAERQKISGSDMLAAFIVGVEVVCRLSKAVSVAPAEGNIAWSQTGICCGVGAAVAAGKLLGLDPRQMRFAIGIAASQASGIRAMHGSMCTANMPAHAGQTGLRAAYLAKAGFTASEGAFEGRYGFANCFAKKPDLAHLTNGLGSHHEILGNTYKPYPCGIVIHPMIDAALELKREQGLDGGQIETVAVKAAPVALALCDRRHPKDEMEGQVSLYQWIAAAFVRGRAGIPECVDAAIADPVLVAFRDRITAVADPSIPADGVDMMITLKDGRTFDKKVRHCIGSRTNPMTDKQLEAKFADQSNPIIGKPATDKLMAECWRVEAMDDAGTLARLAAG
jgi:2-methylcitrate dehydratase PrpD